MLLSFNIFIDKIDKKFHQEESVSFIRKRE